MTRERRSLRSRVTTTLLALGVLSVVALSTVNYVVVSRLLDRSVEAQITTLRDEQADAVRRGFELVEAQVAAIARDPALVDALDELSSAYDAIDVELSAAQLSDLESYHDTEILAPYEAAGVRHPDASDLLPSSTAGRYVQWRHVGDGAVSADVALDDPATAAYDAAFEAVDDYLRGVVSAGVADDLVLFSSSSDEVVYSTDRRIDLGTDLANGPHADSGLGRIAELLPTAAAGEPVVVDGSFYLPAIASPTIFVAASVRTDTEVIGGVALSVPTSVLTDLTTSGNRWDLLGLGASGETYIVGSDVTLRTESRRWLEDPEGYLDRFASEGYPDATADLIRLTDSTVLLQPVDNAVVADALVGDATVGRVTNYLGVSTVAAASPVDVAGLRWAIVAEQATSEASDSLGEYRRTALVLLAIELPIIVLVGMLFARRVVRPIRPLLTYASELSNGDFDARAVDIGRDELGDIARQLGEVSRELRAQERSLADEEERIAQMLAAVLPTRLVERVRRGEIAIADIADTATVVSVSIVDLPDLVTVDQQEAIDVTASISDGLGRLAAEHGIERLHLSPDHQIFVAGLGSPDAEVGRALQFVSAVPTAVSAATEETDGVVDVRLGVAAGDVATGLLGTSQPAFGLWGDPSAIAVTLSAVAGTGEILVDRSIVGALDTSWDVAQRPDPVSVGDDDIEAFAIRPRAADRAR